MPRAFLLTLLALSTLFSAPISIAAESPKLLGSFNTWDAFSYREKGSKVCYIVSSPQDREPKNVRRGDIYAMVTHRPANKVAGVRAAMCHDTYSAHQGVEHDDMNVLCMGARVIGEELAREVVASFLGAAFSGEERHVRRVAKIKAIESAQPSAAP